MPGDVVDRVTQLVRLSFGSADSSFFVKECALTTQYDWRTFPVYMFINNRVLCSLFEGIRWTVELHCQLYSHFCFLMNLFLLHIELRKWSQRNILSLLLICNKANKQQLHGVLINFLPIGYHLRGSISRVLRVGAVRLKIATLGPSRTKCVHYRLAMLSANID